MNSTKCTEKVAPTAHNLLQGMEAERSFLTHPGGQHDPDTLPWKERELQTKTPYELWAKKLNRTLAKGIQQHVKRSTHHDHGDLCQVCKAGSASKSINTTHDTNRLKENHVLLPTGTKKASDKT